MNQTKIKLAFSGGGFRATFYCLGAYRRLIELGLQSNVSHISSVSGGSIAAGAIMVALKQGGFSGIEDFDNRVTKKLIKVGQIDLRKKLFKKFLDIKTIHRLPRSKFSYHAPKLLDDYLFSDIYLKDLPIYPEWSCNTTCLNTKKRFRFKVNEMYGYKIGTSTDINDIKVSFAVASSAAFPIMFAPLKFDVRNRHFFNKYGPESGAISKQNHLYLTDGGVYDNFTSVA